MPENQKKTRREFEAEIIARAWKDEAFRKELLADPKGTIQKEVLKVGGGPLPESIQMQVFEEDAKHIYLVIPRKPVLEAQELTDEQLDQVAGGTVLILLGVAVIVVWP